MNTSPLNISHGIEARMRQATSTAASAEHASFAKRLGDATHAIDTSTSEARKATESQRDTQIRESAEKLVASTFVLPLLQQMRESPFETEMFAPGQGEKLFRQRLDTVLADRIAGSPGFPLVDTLVDRMKGLAGVRSAEPASASTWTTPPSSLATEIDRHA
ncbi:MAG: hypothetical protein ACOC1G_04415 [Phycisphaeraceae bacterium]